MLSSPDLIWPSLSLVFSGQVCHQDSKAGASWATACLSVTGRLPGNFDTTAFDHHDLYALTSASLASFPNTNSMAALCNSSTTRLLPDHTKPLARSHHRLT